MKKAEHYFDWAATSPADEVILREALEKTLADEALDAYDAFVERLYQKEVIEKQNNDKSTLCLLDLYLILKDTYFDHKKVDLLP